MYELFVQLTHAKEPDGEVAAMKERLWKRRTELGSAANRDLLEVLVGNVPLKDAKPEVQQRFADVMAAIGTDRRRSLKEVIAAR